MPLHSRIKTNEGEILIWYLSETEDWFSEKIQMSDKEMIRLNEISNPLMRESFWAIRMMVKLSNLSEIQYQLNGKPLISEGHISISHSGNWLGIQYSKIKEVGLDIEKISPRILKIKDRFLSENEISSVCANEIEKMILCWSAKEAIFKKQGGETVFFKEKIKIMEIDESKKRIQVETNLSPMGETLSYFYPDKNYVLVHTM